MPEVVRCSACLKETYRGLANCPHCGAQLVPLRTVEDDESKKLPDDPPVQHEVFVAGVRSDDFAIAFNEEKLNSEAFYHVWPSLYARQIAQKFILFPVAVAGGLAALFWADGRTEQSLISGLAVGAIGLLLVSLIGGAIFENRMAAIKRRMVKDEAFYRLMVRDGFVIIAEADKRFIAEHRQP